MQEILMEFGKHNLQGKLSTELRMSDLHRIPEHKVYGWMTHWMDNVNQEDTCYTENFRMVQNFLANREMDWQICLHNCVQLGILYIVLLPICCMFHSRIQQALLLD